MKVLEKVQEVLLRRPRRLSLEEYALKLQEKGLHPDGSVVLDPVPIAPPIGYKKHPTMVEIVRDMVKSENLRQAALADGAETFEEADDFDIEDEPPLFRSEWENEFDPPIVELLEAGRRAVAEKSVVKEGDPAGARPAPEPGPGPARSPQLDPAGEGSV